MADIRDAVVAAPTGGGRNRFLAALVGANRAGCPW